MAYPQGYVNQFADSPAYKPDWQFLTQVMGTKQAEYDRGFNMVKSLYNSVLNNPISGEDNEKFRSEAFKKLQNSLKSVSGVDLSNPTNIIKAQGLIAPIADDKELAYDMSVTAYHGKQKQMMDGYKNSSDPKVRAQYNDWSKQDIAYAEQDLRSAKRGNGSIMQVAPRDFVPFEDTMAYLNEAADKAKLKIVQSHTDPSGYIIKDTNGRDAELPFGEWAKTQLGDRFDRQFQVMGRVTAETKIRGIMKDKGLSREDATSSIATDMATQATDQYTKEFASYDASLKGIENKIGIFKKNYPNGINTNPNVKAEYETLLKARDIYKDRVKDTMTQMERMKTDGTKYFSENINSIYTDKIKNQISSNWGKTRADATAQTELTADQAQITKWNIASHEKIANAQLTLGYAQLAQKQKTDELNLRLKVKEMKAVKGAPSEELIGSFQSTETVAAVDQMNTELNSYRGDLFNNAFGAGTGLINMVIQDPKEHNKLFTILSKVKAISSGQGGPLNAEEYGELNKYAKTIGATIKNPWNKDTANNVLDLLAGQTYMVASKNLETYAKIGKTRESAKMLPAFKETIKNMQMINNQGEQLHASYKSIAQAITDANGNLKQGYEKAKLVKHAGDGTPIYDLADVPYELKQSLDNVVGSQFTQKLRPIGHSYNFKGITSGEIQNLFNSKATLATSDGSKLDVEQLSKLPFSDLKKLFGDEARADYNPVTKTVKLQFGVSPGDPIAKTLKLDKAQTITVTVPYESIASSQGALNRLEKYVAPNTVGNQTLGIFNKFSANPNSHIKADSYMKNMGFDFDVAGVMDTNGRYGLGINMTFVNPWTNKTENIYQFQPVDQSKPDSYAKVENLIDTMYTDYLVQRGDHESIFDKDKLTDYPS